jgi:hypothetical protein
MDRRVGRQRDDVGAPSRDVIADLSCLVIGSQHLS